MRIRWFKDALLDLIALRKYIENDNSHAAQDVAKKHLKSRRTTRRAPGYGPHRKSGRNA